MCHVMSGRPGREVLTGTSFVRVRKLEISIHKACLRPHSTARIQTHLPGPRWKGGLPRVRGFCLFPRIGCVCPPSSTPTSKYTFMNVH